MTDMLLQHTFGLVHDMHAQAWCLQLYSKLHLAVAKLSQCHRPKSCLERLLTCCLFVG